MIVKTIGRGQDNNIVVKDENVSRVHLQIVQDDEGNVSVVDLGSTNGTFVNGVRISGETRLKPGDEVRIGDTKLPWQQYFLRPQQPSPSIHQTHIKPSKRDLKWLCFAGGVLLILLVVVGALMVNRTKESESEKDARSQLERLENERKAVDEDYRTLSDQNEIYKKKLSEKEKELEYYKNRESNAKRGSDALKKKKGMGNIVWSKTDDGADTSNRRNAESDKMAEKEASNNKNVNNDASQQNNANLPDNQPGQEASNSEGNNNEQGLSGTSEQENNESKQGSRISGNKSHGKKEKKS